MKRIPVRLGGRSYEVTVGSGLLGQLGETPEVAAHLRGRSVFAVSDRTVHGLYGKVLEGGLGSAGAQLLGWAVLEPGEAHKNLESLRSVWDALVDAGLERGGCVAALGGGVVGDLAGFAAATYHRGVDLIHLPTTLLAMVDSSVGGKTAIDHARGKNLIGAFHQPRAVAADTQTLRTLPRRELLSGFAEVIKAALLGDSTLFELLEERGPAVAEDPDALEEVVARAVAVKAEVVEGDEKETGQRAVLNLGHTLGHAVETAAGYGALTHGEAVALGMGFAVRLSLRRGGLAEAEAQRILRLLRDWGYGLKGSGVSAEKVLQTLRFDKKSSGGAPRWVLLRRIGRAEWGCSVPADDVGALLREVMEAP